MMVNFGQSGTSQNKALSLYKLCNVKNSVKTSYYFKHIYKNDEIYLGG